MTCGVAVKRPYDFEAYLSPDAGVEAKRTKQSHCSPFRPQFGTLAASLPHSQALSLVRDKERSDCDASPFASVSEKYRLSETQLESYLRAEVSYLKRRKLIPRRTESSCVASSVHAQGGSMSSSYRPMPASPSSCHSGSDSDGELSANKISSEAFLYDKPQFSLKQVKMICERLLKEQEVRLRYEYETILNQKLEEKHEQYVQFAKEQIERTNNSTDFSYLS